MRHYLLASVLILVVASSVRADLLPPGQKPVQHLLRIENIKDFPDHYFFVYPRDLARKLPGNSSVRVNDQGEATLAGNPLARRNGVFLYAIPHSLFTEKGQAPKEEWFEKPGEGILKSARLVDPIRTVSVKDPRRQIVTRYRIEIKEGLTLTLLKDEKKAQQQEESAANDNRWMVAGGALMCAFFTSAGLLASRYRRRTPAPVES